MSGRKKAAVIGATGVAGQQAVLALDEHPWFEVTHLVASQDSATYKAALTDRSTGASRWHEPRPVPVWAEGLPVVSSATFDAAAVDVVFSCVESDVAKELEPKYARTTPVISLASAFRMEPDVPLCIPGVNDGHTALAGVQRRQKGWQGFIAATPNCTTTGLAIALKPLVDAFGVRAALMVSLQAMSGAGLSPGVRGMHILDNVIPYIDREELKVRREMLKVLGTLQNGGIAPAEIDVNAICTRVAVLDGHTEAVFAGLRSKAGVDEVKRVLRAYNPLAGEGLPSAPEEYIHVHDDPFRPQPRLDRDLGDGMTTSVGRLEEEPVLGGVKFVLLSHNTKMGAAAGAVLLAEVMARQGVI